MGFRLATINVSYELLAKSLNLPPDCFVVMAVSGDSEMLSNVIKLVIEHPDFPQRAEGGQPLPLETVEQMTKFIKGPDGR